LQIILITIINIEAVISSALMILQVIINLLIEHCAKYKKLYAFKID